MSENPLLPNVELRALHLLLKEATAGEKQTARHTASGPTSREALLAGTLLQLGAQDILVPEPGDLGPSSLLWSRDAENGLPSVLELARHAPQLRFAVSLARGLKADGIPGAVLTLFRAGLTEAGWVKALAEAHADQLPLVLVCADPSGSATFRKLKEEDPKALTWTSAGKAAGRHHLPILSVDGEDAVAVYRVMQESALRARAGGGPVLVWAMLPSAVDLGAGRPKAAAPLRRLKHYLKTRRIPL